MQKLRLFLNFSFFEKKIDTYCLFSYKHKYLTKYIKLKKLIVIIKQAFKQFVYTISEIQ